MDGHNYQEIQENITNKIDQLKKKACEMEENVSANINSLMGTTAEKLDMAAEKMRNTAEFFRNSSADKLKDDVSSVVRKNPGVSLVVAIVLGFLAGKVIFRK